MSEEETETKLENRIAYFDAPADVQVHIAHKQMLAPAADLDVGKCFGIPMTGVNRKLFLELVDDVGAAMKRKLVATESNGYFVISRLPDDYSLTTWRKNKLKELEPTGEESTNHHCAIVAKAIREFMLAPWEKLGTYCTGVPQSLHSARIVPYAYIQRKLASMATLRKDPDGSSVALKRAINRLIERGDLSEISRAELAKDFDTTSRSFRIENLKAFDL